MDINHISQPETTYFVNSEYLGLVRDYIPSRQLVSAARENIPAKATRTSVPDQTTITIVILQCIRGWSGGLTNRVSFMSETVVYNWNK